MRGLLIVCCIFGVSHGWSMKIETVRPRRLKTTLETIFREPAGAESMFRRAKVMRRGSVKRIKGALKKPWKLRIRRRRRMEMEQIDLWGVEKAREDLLLPSWACSDPEEERRLAAMKIMLVKDLKELESKTIYLQKNGRKQVKLVDAFPDVYSDFRLLRFLRKDKVQDPVTAAVRYREFLSWRERNNIDEIRAMIESNIFEPPPELAMVADYVPCEFQAKRSQDGVVPVLLKVGSWDTSSITQLVRSNDLSIETFLQYWTYMFDSLHCHLYQESMREKKMIFIDEVCDLSGMSLKQFSPSFISTILKPWMHLTQSNYPETAKRIVFLNPPKILSVVWKIVTPLTSPGTVAKVSFQSDFNGSGDDYLHHTYSSAERL